MELRRARWLEKLANMDLNGRNPGKLLQAWLPTPRPVGRPFQSIGRGYKHSMENIIGLSPDFQAWMPLAKNNPSTWRSVIELNLGLKKGAYRPLKKTKIPSLIPIRHRPLIVA